MPHRPTSLRLRRFPGLASITRNGSWQASLELYSFALRMLYVVMLSRMLSPAEYGFFAYAQSFYISFLPLVLLGMDARLPLEIGRDGAAARPFMLRIFSLRLVLSGLMIVIAGAVALLSENEPNAQIGLLISSIALLPRGLHLYCGNVFSGFEQIRTGARYIFCFRALEVLIGGTLLWLGAGVITLISLHLICWLAYAFFSCRHIHRHLVPLRFAWEPAQWRRWLLGDNLWLAAQLLLFYLLNNSCFLLYRHLSGDANLFGQTALAFQAITLACGTLAALLAGSVPVMVRSYLRKDGKDALFTLAAAICMLLAGFGVAGLLWFIGAPLVRFCFGDAYSLTAELIAPMALWLPFAAAVQPLQRYLFVHERIDLTIRNYAFGWLVSLAVLWLRHEVNGAHGLIEALVCGYAAACIAAALSGIVLYRRERRAAQNP